MNTNFMMTTHTCVHVETKQRCISAHTDQFFLASMHYILYIFHQHLVKFLQWFVRKCIFSNLSREPFTYFYTSTNLLISHN